MSFFPSCIWYIFIFILWSNWLLLLKWLRQKLCVTIGGNKVPDQNFHIHHVPVSRLCQLLFVFKIKIKEFQIIRIVLRKNVFWNIKKMISYLSQFTQFYKEIIFFWNIIYICKILKFVFKNIFELYKICITINIYIDFIAIFKKKKKNDVQNEITYKLKANIKMVLKKKRKKK